MGEQREPLVTLCRDSDILNPIIRHPTVWPYVSDDMSPSAEEFSVPVDPPFYCLLNRGQTAFFVFHPWTQPHIMEIHTASLPEARGGRTLVHEARDAMRWIFDSLGIFKIQTHVPCDLKHVQRFAHWVGMRDEGLLRKCFMRNGVLLDQWVLGILPEELRCH